MPLHLIYCDEWFWLELKNIFQTDFKINLKLALNKKRFIFSPHYQAGPKILFPSPRPAFSPPLPSFLQRGPVPRPSQRSGPRPSFPPPRQHPSPSLLPLTCRSRDLESQIGGAHRSDLPSTSCPHWTPPYRTGRARNPFRTPCSARRALLNSRPDPR